MLILLNTLAAVTVWTYILIVQICRLTIYLSKTQGVGVCARTICRRSKSNRVDMDFLMSTLQTAHNKRLHFTPEHYMPCMTQLAVLKNTIRDTYFSPNIVSKYRKKSKERKG